MRTEGQGNDGQGNETTRAGPRVGRCGLPGPSFLGTTFFCSRLACRPCLVRKPRLVGFVRLRHQGRSLPFVSLTPRPLRTFR